jgi:predicted nucleic acid-binding protein
LAPTFYLETSIWGSLAPRQPRHRKQVVHRLQKLLDGVRGQCVISDVVVIEIKEASPNKAEQVFEHIDRAQPTIHPISEAIETLAIAYIAAGVLPEGREADALHVAAATCLQLDFLVSWNHRHMTRPKKRLQYESVNRLHGYLKTPMICNPFEACNEIREIRD